MSWRLFQGGKIRNKILLRMLFVAALPLAIFSLLIYYNLTFFHSYDVARIEDNLLNQKTEEIKSFISRATDIFRLRVAIEQTGDVEISQQHFLLNGLLEEVPALEEVSFISLSGQETSRHSRAFPGGVPADELQDQSRIEKFLRAKDGRDYMGEVYFTLKGPMLTVAAPVLNRNNTVIAVLTGELRLSELQTILEKSQLSDQGYIYLINRDGYLIAHSQTEKLTPHSLGQAGFNRSLLSGQAFTTISGQRRYQSFWGEPVVAAGLPFRNFQWGLVAEWPVSDADWLLNLIFKQIFLILLVVIAGTLALGYILSSLIVKPIKSLEAATQAVARGKLDQEVVVGTNDELAELAGAFNKMLAGLKQLEELKKEFVFIAAHELRTPVTAIQGYLSMIMEGDAGRINKQVREFISQVIAANDRLAQLVNDLLEVARSEAGRLTIKVAPTQAVEPIQQVITELKPLAAEKKIKVIYAPTAPVPPVLADSDRVKEVMVNLLGNAIKYTIGRGTVTITHALKDRELITAVADTGLGISQEAQPKLFEKFYRVQTDQTHGIAGTGLGLFIVKQIVEKMNGRIWVKSEEGKGSTFSFSLPLA